MTLKEAYEIRRKEVLSLQAENKKLKKQLADGTFPSKEKEDLERHIRHLQQVIQTAEKRYRTLRESCDISDRIRHDLQMQIMDLTEKISSLQNENEVLSKRAQDAEEHLRVLQGTNRKLEKRLNTSFENSSLPSSALPFRKKIPNSRKPSGKKPGGQPGHCPHTAATMMATTSPVHLPVPEQFLNNPDLYPTGKTITKQLIGIRFSVEVQDFIADIYRNKKTGAKVHAPFPKGVVNRVNYAPSVKAFAFLLNNYYNVSVSKTCQCISDMTGGIVHLSAGTICNLSSEFSKATLPDRARIHSRLRQAHVLYSDATVSNVNGSRKAVILTTDKKIVLYQHLEHKGHDGLEKTPLKGCRGTVVHDHDRSYYSYGSRHQECLAHVLRYLVGAMENEPGLSWHRQMHSLLQQMIHAFKNRRSVLSKEKIRLFTEKYEKILSTAAEEYRKHPPEKDFMDGFNLQKRMRIYQDAHLYFLSHPEVDPTNNISERELRKFKRKQKQAVVLRSLSGGQHICDALTIIETARMQHRNIYHTVETVFSG